MGVPGYVAGHRHRMDIGHLRPSFAGKMVIAILVEQEIKKSCIDGTFQINQWFYFQLTLLFAVDTLVV
jgi:hypothetical protein